MEPSRKLMRYPQLVPLWMAIFSDIIGFSLLITVYPSLMTQFQVQPVDIGLLIAVNGVFAFIAAPIWGKLSDHHGRKPMLILSQLGTLASFLLLAFSGSIEMVLISRIVDGIFSGNFPISRAVINDVVSPHDMAREMTNMGLAHNVANLIGPALGGVLYVSCGLIGPGLAAAATSLFTLVVTVIKLQETAPIKVHPEIFSPGIPAESKAEITAVKFDPPSPPQNPSLVWYHNRALVLAFLILLFASIGFMTQVSNFAMFGLLKLDLDAAKMGIFLMIGGVVQITVRFTIFMPLLRKWGEYLMVIIGFLFYLIGFGLIGFVLAPWQLLSIMILNSFATSGTRGGLTAFISQLADPKERGKIQGFATSIDTFAQILGPIIGGLVLTYLALEWFGSVSWLCMAVALGIMIGARPLRRALREKQLKIPSFWPE